MCLHLWFTLFVAASRGWLVEASNCYLMMVISSYLCSKHSQILVKFGQQLCLILNCNTRLKTTHSMLTWVSHIVKTLAPFYVKETISSVLSLTQHGDSKCCKADCLRLKIFKHNNTHS